MDILQRTKVMKKHIPSIIYREAILREWKGVAYMIFTLKLSDHRGFKYLLSADIGDRDPIEVAAKIKEELVVEKTQDYSLHGQEFKGKNPEILKQLKEIVGVEFSGFEPDLALRFGGEDLQLDSIGLM